MSKPTYIGYSSDNFEYNKSFILTNVDVVNTDLRNHIFTRRGERVNLNNFGTSIPDLLMEPLDTITLSILENELTEVFAFDPRVQLVELTIVPDYDNNSISASAILNYIELNLQDRFDINLQFEV